MRIAAIGCLVMMAVGLAFSQRAREMVTGLSGSPALRHFIAGRKLLLANFAAAPTARFMDYDGHTNTATHLYEDIWVATGFVEYEWQGSPRRSRWSCAFATRTRDLLALEVGPTREATPEFDRKLEAIRRGQRPRQPHSTASAIEESWGWRTP